MVLTENAPTTRNLTVVAQHEDPEIQLLVPTEDCAEPEVSIVIPALNEEITISEFVAWCREGLAQAQVAGEILIVDSSKDRTAELALAAGARVLKTPKRGLGRAYIDALPIVRGRYIIMGDADCTYDFRQLKPFVDKFRAGYEFIMGSRFSGYIEPGSMPALHRYFGTPATTWMLDVLYQAKFTDIHCGMRGITRDALWRLNLESQSWEYASEMVLKSVHMELKTAEVPVRFLKDREGRISHHKRSGWFSPWQAGWINLRAMLTYGADFFVLKPGLVALAAGLALTLPLAVFGPITVGKVTLSLYWMLVGVAVTLLGLQSFFLGCLAKILYDFTGKARRRWLGLFRYTRSVVLSGALLISGAALTAPLIRVWLGSDYRLPEPPTAEQYWAIAGLLVGISGFLMFIATLLMHAAARLADRCYGRPS